MILCPDKKRKIPMPSCSVDYREMRQSEKYRQCYKTYLSEPKSEGMSMFNSGKITHKQKSFCST